MPASNERPISNRLDRTIVHSMDLRIEQSLFCRITYTALNPVMREAVRFYKS